MGLQNFQPVREHVPAWTHPPGGATKPAAAAANPGEGTAPAAGPARAQHSNRDCSSLRRRGPKTGT